MTDSELLAHIDKVASDYEGDCFLLYSAIGATMACRSYGWRVVRLTTASNQYTRHQRIIGLEFKSVFPAETELSSKSVGYKIAVNLGKFWDVVRGIWTIPPKEKTMFHSAIE